MANLFPRKNQKPAEEPATTAPVAEATAEAPVTETPAEQPAEPKAEKPAKEPKAPKAAPTAEELTAKLAEARKTWDDLKAEQKAIITASGTVPAELTKKITHARRAHRALLKSLGQFIPVKDRPKAEKPVKTEKPKKNKKTAVKEAEQPAPEAAPAPAE